ncbi:MAG: DMT family transporter [Nitratireductor sp.]|nr:DMT family transporter [Nitratireductor sp.]
MPDSTPGPNSQNLRGAAFMTVGMAGFSVNDTIIKSFADDLGIGQIILLRGIIASIMIYALARKFRHMLPLSALLNPLILMRSVADMSATFLFITALFHMPIANATAILQALPLALTLAAALFLSEQIGWRRLTAIFVGFVGVLVVIRPGIEGFSTYSLYALATVAACVVRDLTTRRMHAGIPALFITFSASISVTLLGAALSLFGEWQPVSPTHLGLLVMSAAVLLIGYFGVISSMRTGDLGFVSPFRYSILLFSIFAGMIVFREFPDTLTWIGSAIIVSTGIYTLYRERVVHRQSITPPAPMRS